jgi:hypothetical protein
LQDRRREPYTQQEATSIRGSLFVMDPTPLKNHPETYTEKKSKNLCKKYYYVLHSIVVCFIFAL